MSVKDTDLGWARIQRELTLFSQFQIVTGFRGGKDSEVAIIAAYMEFGTESSDGEEIVPARPFMSSAMDVGAAEIAKAADAALIGIVDQGKTALEVAKNFGEVLVKLIKNRILDSPAWAEELKNATIAAKGSSKPLVDTAQMLNSVTYAVKRGETVVAQG